MNKVIPISIIVIGAILVGVTFSSFSGDTSDESSMVEFKSVGAIMPLTGDLSTHGEEEVLSAELAVADFNLHLEELGESWMLNLVIEDTGTNPVIALEKLTSLHAKGIEVVVGPQSSAELRLIKGYADSNGVVLLSPSSTSPALSIPNDHVFRLTPDDTKQGPALAKLLMQENISVIIPVWRGDTWGDGLKESTSNSFTERGGTVVDGIRYNQESPEFSASTSLLADKISEQLQNHEADKVAIVYLGFAEVLQFMQSASQHDVLDDVRWFGADANTKEEKLITDPIGLKFSQEILFTTTQVALNDNPTSKRVQDYVKEKLGRTPNSYAHSMYDGVFIAGLALLETQDTTDSIKDVIPMIAENYSGAIGSGKLNDAGDLDTADYDIWGIRGGEWVLLGGYAQSTDSVTYN